MTVLSPFLMSEEQQAKRRLSMGGSDANTIMSGDPDRLMELWREKRGDGKPQEPTLNMLMGTVTEALNAAWYAHTTRDPVGSTQAMPVTSINGTPIHATLDGICKGGAAVWEAKHTSGYDFQAKERRSAESMAEYYFPQLQHNMLVTGLKRAVLSVFFDNNRHEFVEIEADSFYQDTLLAREAEFWACVQSGKPPVAQAPLKVVPKIVATRVQDFTGNNEWASFAAQWLETKAASDKHADAVSGIKSLMEADVATAKGHGVIARRDKRGAVRISAE